MDGGLARAPSLRPPPKGGKAGLRPGQRKAFEAAPPGRVLASEERERARARLRAALARHWLFESFDSKQIEATAKAMRHQSVPQGKVVSAQGEAATKFYVVTEGGFDITVATQAAPAVLVAQVGYLPYISPISPLYLPYISPAPHDAARGRHRIAPGPPRGDRWGGRQRTRCRGEQRRRWGGRR